MSQAETFPSFPPLTWDQFFWSGSLTTPYRADSWSKLVVRGDVKNFEKVAKSKVPPPPTSEQTAALEFLLKHGPAVKQALLPQFHKHVPELADQDWPAVEAFFELARIVIFYPATDGVAYCGLVWNCLQFEFGYEHGVGIVLHKDRVVHFGMADEATDETQPLKDQRRLARQRKAKQD